MSEFSVPVEISKKAIDDFVAGTVVDDPGLTLAKIAAAFLPCVSKMEESVAKLAIDAPLFAMLPQQLFADDHVAGKVGSVDDDASGRLLRQTLQWLQFHLPWLRACVYAATEKHDLTPNAFVAWANRQGLFDAGKVPLLTAGFQAWFDKDNVKALHILIPQIEAALRNMVDRVGKPVTKAAGTVPGVSVAINMSDILFNSATIAALGPMGSNLALYMKAIYADPRGMNIRNQFAHGLLDADEIHEGIVLWIVHTLLVVGTWQKLDPP